MTRDRSARTIAASSPTPTMPNRTRIATTLTRGPPAPSLGVPRTTSKHDRAHDCPPCRCVCSAATTSSTVRPARVGVGKHAGDERAQPAIVLARRMRLRRGRADERSDASPRLEHAGAFELGVHARHGIGVDFQFDGELADGRELIAGPQPARWRSPRAARARAARKSASRRACQWRRSSTCPIVLVH